MSQYKLIGPISQLITLADLPLKGPLKDEQLSVVENAGVLIDGQFIKKISSFAGLRQEAKELKAEVIELSGDHVCLPGFIDSHTHICFAGSRAKDYAMRNAGRSYLEIARAGGGIWDTVTQTRKASQQKLMEGIIKRAESHVKDGITTIEVKSGYGLSVEEELKMLRAIRAAGKTIKADLIPTCLAAHTLPKDFDGDHSDYLNEISRHLFPVLKAEKLANRIDAFIEEEAFSPEIISPYFERAKSMGLDLTVHADQFHTGGSQVAVNFNAVSADHLEASTDKEIELLAKSSVIATALPGASLGLGCDFAPTRKLLDAGTALAIASDWNPGSAPMGDLLTQAAILGTYQKLSNAEIFAGITFRAANALRLKDRGLLKAGFLADLVLFPTADFREILYHQGRMVPDMVWKRGELASG